MRGPHLVAVRLLGAIVVAFGLSYLGWRWVSTTDGWVNWAIAVPLVLAETFSFLELMLSVVALWHARLRPPPPPARPGRTVDVFITTVDEPLALVLKTAIAARDMTYPHTTWILDDGRRAELAAAARLLGVGYLSRGPEWDGRPRFAKAGNVNDALSRTSGELIAILDADQVPEPWFLDRVLGYFDDDDIAFVQTPQSFWNVLPSDPLGSQAQMFYGPIQQGKDGWNASFFCGSNAVLRREALMAVGLSRYAGAALGRSHAALRAGRSRLVALRRATADARVSTALQQATDALSRAQRRLRAGDVLAEVTYELRTVLDVIAFENSSLSAELAQELRAVAAAADMACTDMALAVHPMDISCVTEDMATAMHLHAMGWSSAYHHEVIVHGLAPEDVKTALAQRRRWAAGTLQIFFADNPLFVRGLSFAQRLMYLCTTLGYLSGFATLVYLAAPVLLLGFGIFPVRNDPLMFVALFVPFFLAAQVFGAVVGWGVPGKWRTRQLCFALFPTWIAATFSAANATYLGRRLSFTVTAKVRQSDGSGFRLLLPQLVAMAVLVVASAVGIVRAAQDHSYLPATALSLIWVVFDLCLLGVVLRMGRYRGSGPSVVDPLPAPPELAWVLDRVTATLPTRPLPLREIVVPEPALPAAGLP
ncbi:glycosyltransferase family 2 protein [Spongisporangium articulatum]|uniref:Glycosyltransferase family 2 protein n=1 Tax=Spongisporangium articulatum TaxID=3362603 RepID=A0ABW8AM64_9ACTN